MVCSVGQINIWFAVRKKRLSKYLKFSIWKLQYVQIKQYITFALAHTIKLFTHDLLIKHCAEN